KAKAISATLYPGSRCVPTMTAFTANTRPNNAHARGARDDRLHVATTKSQNANCPAATTIHAETPDGPRVVCGSATSHGEPGIRTLRNEAGMKARNQAVVKKST